MIGPAAIYKFWLAVRAAAFMLLLREGKQQSKYEQAARWVREQRARG